VTFVLRNKGRVEMDPVCRNTTSTDVEDVRSVRRTHSDGTA